MEKDVLTPGGEEVEKLTTEETTDDSLFDWSDLNDDDTPSDSVDDVDKGEKEYWQIAAEKSGIEAKSENEFIEKVKSEKVKEVYVDEKDPHIRQLKSYVSMKDEDLVREDKKARGWDADKIDKYLAKNADNIEFEAEDIRSTLKNTITQRQSEIEKTQNDTAAARKQEILDLQKNVKDYLSKTNEVLGFKVGRDEQATTKWQKGMEKYLTSGGIFKELDAIVKDAKDGKPERLVELAQFIKSKDGIVKGMLQKGKSQEAEKFLTDLQNSHEERKTGGESVKDGKKGLDAWVL